MKHIPVLLNSVMEALGDIRNKTIIDCTFGAGGYSRMFLQAGANVIAFDRDPGVMIDVDDIKTKYKNQFTFIGKSFSHISELPQLYDAIVFDLGISSMQIDNPERGFSFRSDAPLDMRMSQMGPSASDLIAQTSVEDLAQILRDYGDIKKATVLARAIKDSNPQTTFELRDLIYTPRDVAPVFQALRIAVNDEFGEIQRALSVVPEKLNIGGKCICVTFHSIEDRIVKNTFRDWTKSVGDARLPQIVQPRFDLIKPVTPTNAELEQNPRARSAHMRGVVKSY